MEYPAKTWGGGKNPEDLPPGLLDPLLHHADLLVTSVLILATIWYSFGATAAIVVGLGAPVALLVVRRLLRTQVGDAEKLGDDF